MRILREVIIDALSAGSTQTSAAIDASQMSQASIQGVCTGTAEGNLSFEISNDIVTLPEAPTNWTPVVSTAVTLADSGVLLLDTLCYNFIRAKWTNTAAGTGTVTVKIKSIGW